MRELIIPFRHVPAELPFDAPPHNYLRLQALVPLQFFRPGKLIDTLVEHDDDCGVYSHALCNCHPDITMRDADTNRVLCTMRWRGDDVILRFPDP